MEGQFLDKFIQLLGDQYVSVEAAELEAAAQTNYRTDKKILVIIRPESTEEVAACMKIANEYSLDVYPVSRGKNWGYGSRVPLKNNSVLMELGRMNRIHEHSDKYGYVTLEPGVTFQQLFDYLREHNSDLIMSSTGGGLDSSVVGNAIERGIGTGLYADRFSTVCNIQAVLPQGDIISTGFGRFDDDAQVGKLYKWGLGPNLDGLFSQSNFGVVTKLTTWLMKSPDYFQLLFYKVNDDEKLFQLIDELRELSMNGLVRPTITIYNEFRVISTMIQYPFATCDPKRNTYQEAMDELKKQTGLGSVVAKWNGEISIRSMSEEHGRIQYELIKERISKYLDDITVVSIDKPEIMDTLRKQHEGKFEGHGNDLVKSFLVRKYIGIPDNLALKQAYWRKRKPVPKDMDPDRDKCGLLWISPMIPFNGGDLEQAVAIISEVASKFFFEPAISLQCMTERAINIIASINWDREEEGEDELAEKCYHEMVGRLKECGYYAYRNTTLGMSSKSYLPAHENSYSNLLKVIKDAVDPKHILASGRYNID